MNSRNQSHPNNTNRNMPTLPNNTGINSRAHSFGTAFSELFNPEADAYVQELRGNQHSPLPNPVLSQCSFGFLNSSSSNIHPAHSLSQYSVPASLDGMDLTNIIESSPRHQVHFEYADDIETNTQIASPRHGDFIAQEVVVPNAQTGSPQESLRLRKPRSGSTCSSRGKVLSSPTNSPTKREGVEIAESPKKRLRITLSNDDDEDYDADEGDEDDDYKDYNSIASVTRKQPENGRESGQKRNKRRYVLKSTLSTEQREKFEKEQLIRKREKNKILARTSRERKKKKMDELEQTINEQNDIIAEKDEKIAHMKQEISLLKSKLRQYMDEAQ